MREYVGIVTNVSFSDDGQAVYTVKYTENGQTRSVCVAESSASVTEEGDRVRLFIDDGGMARTDISETLKKRNLLMLAVLLGVLTVIAGIIAMFLLIDNLVFRIALAVLVAAFLIIINLL